MVATTNLAELTGRGRSILRAVAAGRAELTCSCEPDLRVDGLLCCDQSAARALVHSGYIRLVAAKAKMFGSWERAELTAAGQALLLPAS